MFITKRSLPRRTVLRGVGTTLALPLLDAMAPALSALTRTAVSPVRRFSTVYIPNGAVLNIRLPNGSVIDKWTPVGEGSGFQFSPILKSLEPFRDHLVVLSGLGSRPSDSWGEGTGDHARACSSWLNATHIKRTESDPQAGTTIDQLAANELGKETQLRSLELAVDDLTVIGACDNGYACTYFNTLSWRSPTTPVPCQINPRVVFERMFGDGRGMAARRAQLERNRSILDSVTGEVTGLQRQLDARDRTKIDEYLDSIRELELRIRKIEDQQGAMALELPERPIGIPDTFDDHVKLMFDLQVLAFRADITRVSTFLLAREASFRAYPNVGVPDAHHGLSHHGNDPEKIEKMSRINAYHAQLLAYYVEKLRSAPDGDGSLLDHMVILYGGGMSNGNLHNHVPLPVVLVGGAAGRLKGNRHLTYEMGTPMANLLVSLLDMVGAPTERIGDSTGRLTGV